MFGGISSIAARIVMGYIVQMTGSFVGALAFIGAKALVTILSEIVIVRDLERVAPHPAAVA